MSLNRKIILFLFLKLQFNRDIENRFVIQVLYSNVGLFIVQEVRKMFLVKKNSF